MESIRTYNNALELLFNSGTVSVTPPVVVVSVIYIQVEIQQGTLFNFDLKLQQHHLKAAQRPSVAVGGQFPASLYSHAVQ